MTTPYPELILGFMRLLDYSELGQPNDLARWIETYVDQGLDTFDHADIRAARRAVPGATVNDVLLALSFSGESEEVIKLFPAVRRLDIRVIGMVGNRKAFRLPLFSNKIRYIDLKRFCRGQRLANLRYNKKRAQ